MIRFEAMQGRDIPEFVKCLSKYPLAMDDSILEIPMMHYRMRLESDFTLYMKGFNDETFLGYMALDPISDIDATIHFVRNPARVKKNIYLDISKQFIKKSFQDYPFQRLTLYVNDGAKSAFELAKQLGFVLEGTIRKCRKIRGVFHDVHIFSILREEM